AGPEPLKGAAARVLRGWHPGDEAAGSRESAPLKTHNDKPIPEHGCMGEAQEELSKGVPQPVGGTSPGGVLDAVNRVQRLGKEAGEQVSRDRRVKDVAAKWAAWYRKRPGDTATDPAELARDPRWQS